MEYRDALTLARGVGIFALLGPLLAGGFLVVVQPLAFLAWALGIVPAAIAGLLFGAIVVALRGAISSLLNLGYGGTIACGAALLGAVAGVIGVLAAEAVDVAWLNAGAPSLFDAWRPLGGMAGAICGVVVVVVERWPNARAA